MKNKANFPVIVLFMTAAVFAGGCKKNAGPSSGTVNEFKRYPYERFHLTYEYTGDLRGTEELFVSGYGKYEARYSKFEILTPEAIRPIDNSSITRMSDIYVINYLEKSVMHDHVAQLDSLYHLGANDIPSSQEYLESEMKRNLMTNSGK